LEALEAQEENNGDGVVLMAYASERKKNSTQWKKLRLMILNRDSWSCQYCGEVERSEMTIDHIIPIARGGTDEPENLIAACKRCNYSKQDKVVGDPNRAVFFERHSTATSSRGFFSPQNESISYD
jgi:5-methylcytosine-specific restriction endonuclease McrA